MLLIGTKIGNLNGEMALFCVIIPNLVVFRAHCVKVVDKAITMDNFRLQFTIIV